MSLLAKYYAYIGPFERPMNTDVEYLELALEALSLGQEVEVKADICTDLCQDHLTIVVLSDQDETSDTVGAAVQTALEEHIADVAAGRPGNALYVLPRKFDPDYGYWGID